MRPVSITTFSYSADKETPDPQEMKPINKCLREGCRGTWDKRHFFLPVNTYQVDSWSPMSRGGNWLGLLETKHFYFWQNQPKMVEDK